MNFTFRVTSTSPFCGRKSGEYDEEKEISMDPRITEEAASLSLFEQINRGSVSIFLRPANVLSSNGENESLLCCKVTMTRVEILKGLCLVVYLPLLCYFFVNADSHCGTALPVFYFALVLCLVYLFPLFIVSLSPLLLPLFKYVNFQLDIREKEERSKFTALVDCFTASEHMSRHKVNRIIATVNLILTLMIFLMIDLLIFLYGIVVWFESMYCQTGPLSSFYIFTLVVQCVFTILPCLYFIFRYISVLMERVVETKEYSPAALKLQECILSKRWEDVVKFLEDVQNCRLWLPNRHIALSLALTQSDVPFEVIHQMVKTLPSSIDFIFDMCWYASLNMIELAVLHKVSPKVIQLLLSSRIIIYSPHLFWAIQLESDAETVAVLLNFCPSALLERNRHEQSLLHLLIQDSRYDRLSEYVLRELHAADQVDEDLNLPIHFALTRRAQVSLIKRLLELYPQGIALSNKDKLLPIELLFKMNQEVPIEYVTELLTLFRELEVLASTWIWMIKAGNEFISLESQKRYTEAVLEQHPLHLHDFIYAVGKDGLPAVKVAPTEVVAIMERFLLFCGRFEIQQGVPLHRSETSIIYLARDFVNCSEEDHDEIEEDRHSEETESLIHHPFDKKTTSSGRTGHMLKSMKSPEPVILKFMKHEPHFLRELLVRDTIKQRFRRNPSRKSEKRGDAVNTSYNPMIETVISYRRDSDNDFDSGLQQLGLKFDAIQYCLVMPAAERNLKTIIDTEGIAGMDEASIFEIAKQLASGLEFLHSHGIIHGDFKPLNIVRLGMRYKIIDFDAAVAFLPEDKAGYCGLKYSSAYLPPEMLWKDSKTGKIGVRSVPDNQQDDVVSLPYQLLKARPSFDLWSYGCILYQLFTNEVLWKANGNDNLNDEELAKLYTWNDPNTTVKPKLLSRIQTPRQYYLLNQILSEVSKGYRHSIAYVLNHAYFHPSKTSIRMPGEEYKHHVFISYRVASDAHHALTLYEYLQSRGITVWLDQKNILLGEDWKESFCEGLVQAKVFLPLISREALQPYFPKLTATAACDNVLLEYRLALELKKRGYVEKICPLFIGDQSRTTAAAGEESYFSDYFRSGCDPVCPDLVNAAIEENVHEILEKYCFGTTLLPNLTVKATFNEIKKIQGSKVMGPGSFLSLIEKLGDTLVDRILN